MQLRPKVTSMKASSAKEPQGGRLESWKEIAAYLGRSERTVRRWEAEEALPVHRLTHKKRSSIYAYPKELDEWLESRCQLVQETQVEAEPDTPERVESPETGIRTEVLPVSAAKLKPLTVWLVAGVTLAAVISFAVYLLLRPAPPPLSLAVLPFTNESADESLRYLAEGISGTVVDYIAQAPDLQVRPFETSRRFRRNAEGPASAGRKMGVDVVLSGSVSTPASGIQIKVTLIDVPANAQIWAESYSVQESQLAETARTIALAAREQILRRVHGDAYRPAAYRAPVVTQNPEAYREFLRGNGFGANVARAPVEAGIRHLDEAIRLDPGLGAAWSARGTAHMALSYFSELPASETIAQGKADSLKAIELEPSNSIAWKNLAFASQYDFDHAAAEKLYRKSIELNPQNAVALAWFGSMLIDMRRFQEARKNLDRASEVSPAWLEVESDRADSYYFAGDLDHSMAVYQRNLDAQPNYGLSRLYLGRLYLAKGQFEEAIVHLRRGNDLLGQVPFSVADLAYGLAVGGHRDEAEALLADMIRKREQSYYPAFAVAEVHVGLGHLETALDWLEKIPSEHLSGWYSPYVDPFYNPVRSHPRFQRLMQRMDFIR